MMIPNVPNCRARNASAPSWIALAMSFIDVVPWSAASTPRTRNEGDGDGGYGSRGVAKYSQSFSLLVSKEALESPFGQEVRHGCGSLRCTARLPL